MVQATLVFFLFLTVPTLNANISLTTARERLKLCVVRGHIPIKSKVTLADRLPLALGQRQGGPPPGPPLRLTETYTLIYIHAPYFLATLVAYLVLTNLYTLFRQMCVPTSGPCHVCHTLDRETVLYVRARSNNHKAFLMSLFNHCLCFSYNMLKHTYKLFLYCSD